MACNLESLTLKPPTRARDSFWSSSTTLKAATRHRAATPDLSVITRSHETSIASPLNATVGSKPIGVLLQDVSAIVKNTAAPLRLQSRGSPTAEDPDETRDFSRVKSISLKRTPLRTPIAGDRRPPTTQHPQPLSSCYAEPAHAILDKDIKFLNSWPVLATTSVPSATLSTRMQAGEYHQISQNFDIRQIALRNIREFIDSEMRLVQVSNTAAAYGVYREAFAKVVDEFSMFGDVLSEIQRAYDNRVDELEELSQRLMMSDEGIQAEKEKLLELQNHVIASLEKEKKSVDLLRVKASDLEAANVDAQRRFDEQLKAAKDEIVALRLEILKERTVRIEHEDNLNTALRLMREAQERAAEATGKLEVVESSLTAEVERQRRELHASSKDLENLKVRSEVALAHAEKKFRDLQATCVDASKLDEMRAALEKVGRSNVVLSKRNKWLEERIKMAAQTPQ